MDHLRGFGVPGMVAIDHAGDARAELDAIRAHAAAHGSELSPGRHRAEGSAGIIGLAERVAEIAAAWRYAETTRR